MSQSRMPMRSLLGLKRVWLPAPGAGPFTPTSTEDVDV